METDLRQAFATEWRALQQGFEKYEHGALIIKLSTIVVVVFGIFTEMDPVIIGAVVVLLWLQEAIVRTSQSRLGSRLLKVEASLAETKNYHLLVFQLHTDWHASRSKGLGLLKEYALNALRPTVAYLYVSLLVISQAAIM